MYFGVSIFSNVICVSEDGYSWQTIPPTNLDFQNIVFIDGYYFAFNDEQQGFQWTNDLQSSWTTGALDTSVYLLYLFQAKDDIYAVAPNLTVQATVYYKVVANSPTHVVYSTV